MDIKLKLADLLYPRHNTVYATNLLCKTLKIPVAEAYLLKLLEEHPDYPSLLSVTDVLTNIGVENIATQVRAEQLTNFDMPFLAQVSLPGQEKQFCVVLKATPEEVRFISPVSKKEEVFSMQKFSRVFIGYVLLAEEPEEITNAAYLAQLQKEKREKMTVVFRLLILPLLVLLSCSLALVKYGTIAAPAVLYALVTLAGVLVTSLLLWYEIDRNNSTLKEICSSGKSINCEAILFSNASKFFGVSWSAIGFTYFAGSLVYAVISGIYNVPALFQLSWINAVALPYVFFSIFYQYRIAKQWCSLCLTTQAILLIQFVVALAGHFHTGHPNVLLYNVTALVTSFVAALAVALLLPPLLKKANENSRNQTELQRLKHNSEIFNSLLQKQKQVTDPSGLGIIIGNPAAKYRLTKVCNPYCGPCAKAHPVIDEILKENPDIQVQILFTTDGSEYDRKTGPVRHLLAIDSKQDQTLTMQALDDWYMPEFKNYEAFAAKYPMNGELAKQEEKMKKMHEWCVQSNISFTPTFFVNGYQLPEIYKLQDLKYFFLLQLEY